MPLPFHLYINRKCADRSNRIQKLKSAILGTVRRLISSAVLIEQLYPVRFLGVSDLEIKFEWQRATNKIASEFVGIWPKRLTICVEVRLQLECPEQSATCNEEFCFSDVDPHTQATPHAEAVIVH